MPNPIAYNVNFISPLEGLKQGQALGDSFVKADLANEYSGLVNTQTELTNEALGITNKGLTNRLTLQDEATRLANEATTINNETLSDTNRIENTRRRLENEALRRANAALLAEGDLAEEEDARITRLYDKIANGTATPQDYQILAALLPEDQSKAVRESLAIMTKQQQEREVAELAPIFSAFHSGSPVIGIGLLKNQAEAYRNAGDTKSADIFDSMISVAESGKEGTVAVQAYIGYMMTELEGGTDIMEGAKTYWEIEKLRAEIEALLRPDGTLSIEDIFSMEKQLRDEYGKLSAPLRLARLDYDKAVQSAATGTGAGDVALVFGFMRMLDPGSVVRESEFAQARDTAGLWESLRVQYEKLRVGESLSPVQRASFLALSRKYMEGAEDDAARAREDLELVIKDYGLNRNHVFGVVGEDEETSVGGLNDLRDWIEKNNPGDRGIQAMSEEAIRAKYPNGYAAFAENNPRTSRNTTSTTGQTVIGVDY